MKTDRRSCRCSKQPPVQPPQAGPDARTAEAAAGARGSRWRAGSRGSLSQRESPPGIDRVSDSSASASPESEMQRRRSRGEFKGQSGKRGERGCPHRVGGGPRHESYRYKFNGDINGNWSGNCGKRSPQSEHYAEERRHWMWTDERCAPGSVRVRSRKRPKIPRARQRLRTVVALIRQGVSGNETVSDIETVSGNDEKSSAVSGNGRRFLERASGCGKLWH